MLSEQEIAVHRYNTWQKVREKAIHNAGGALPAGLVDIPRSLPPPPSSVDEPDILNLSMELNAASIDDVTGDLDEHGIERVPMADPGFDVCECLSQQPILLLNISIRDHCLMSATRKALLALLECTREERVYCQVRHPNSSCYHTVL